MTGHSCRRCGYKTDRTSNLARHLKQSSPCVPLDVDSYHDPSILLKDLQKDKRRYTKRGSHQSVNNITNYITNNNIVVVNQFSFSDFGHENVKTAIIDGGDYLRKNPNVVEMIKNIHYDPGQPENHNVCVTNVKDDVAYIVKKGEFCPESAAKCAYDELVNSNKRMGIYLSWNEEDLTAEEMKPWKDLEDLLQQSTASEKRAINKHMQKTLDAVLRVMHHESKKIWPRGSKDLIITNI